MITEHHNAPQHTLHEIWEMAQMYAYVETAVHSWRSALAAGDLFWGLRGCWNICATAAVLGLAYAAPVECAALAAGRWSHTERMPVVPRLGAGLWPLLQMTLLPPLTFWVSRWWAGRSVTKGFQ